MEVDCTANLELIKTPKWKEQFMLYHPTFMLYAHFFAIFSLNISHKIRSTNELHRSSKNWHPGVGKIVRCLRTSRKIYKITSRFKCIEANWALFKMIIFLFTCFFVFSYFFLLFISVFFILYFRFFSGTFMRTLHIGSYALLYSAFYYCQSFSRSVHAFFIFLIKNASFTLSCIWEV